MWIFKIVPCTGFHGAPRPAKFRDNRGWGKVFSSVLGVLKYRHRCSHRSVDRLQQIRCGQPHHRYTQSLKRFQIFYSVSKRGRLKVESRRKSRPNFALLTPPIKIWGGCGDVSGNNPSIYYDRTCGTGIYICDVPMSGGLNSMVQHHGISDSFMKCLAWLTLTNACVRAEVNTALSCCLKPLIVWCIVHAVPHNWHVTGSPSYGPDPTIRTLQYWYLTFIKLGSH